ncbi:MULTISPECIES: hypothetical protein [unclassified Actinotalea]|uniref:hypothetical protein n=1 Tax=unclassified Actinotalea TaxID=2638618 RepID=UPI0015F4466C|nr:MULTISPECIES: hypothetical protein [unclassified Actinotalea]
MNLDTGVGNDDARTGLEPEPEVVEAVERADTEHSQEVMSLLAQGVPLALLADLASPDGPASPEILEDEGLPEVAWWDAEDAPASPDAVPEAADAEPRPDAG